MAKIITTTVYEFEELSDKAKEKARDWYRQFALDDEWWEYVYEDAKEVGLKITAFDLGRANSIEGSFIDAPLTVCNKIFANHGETCDTHKTAKAHYDALQRDDTDAETEFKRALLEDYLSHLRVEMEYLESNESVDENITANGYTFLESGKREG